MKKITIAIDGPAASGKSTVAKLVANTLNYIYVDSGAMYRALTLKALQNKVKVDDEEALMNLLNNTKIEFINNHIYLDNDDVSVEIRSQEVSENVSNVSFHGKIRKHMVSLQQEIGRNGGIVMDGRDIGTCVFPNAELKIFQVASVKQRALRRYEEYKVKGINCELKEIEEDIRLRDFKDTTRKISPLKKARDAYSLDTSYLTPEESCAKILELFNKVTSKEGIL